MVSRALQLNRASSPLRKIMISRLEAVVPFNISPFERWPDEHYSPQPLEYMWRSTAREWEIIAPIHDFDPTDVHVDLSRGHVIILLSRAYHAGQTGSESAAEYYCEIAIPAGVNRRQAAVEIRDGLLYVTLRRRWNPLKLLKRAAKPEATQTRSGWRLLPLEPQA